MRGGTNGKQGKCSHTCVFGKQFECEHTRIACQNACWGASPNPRRRKVRFAPFTPFDENCTRSLAPPLPTQSASLGLRVAPIGCGPVLMLWALTLGQNVPKQKCRGTAQNCSPADQKMWKVFSNIRTGHIIVLPPHETRLETIENRAFFRAKCSHISSSFGSVPDSRKRT